MGCTREGNKKTPPRVQKVKNTAKLTGKPRKLIQTDYLKGSQVHVSYLLIKTTNSLTGIL